MSLFKQLLYLVLGVFSVGLQMCLCDIIYRSLSAVALTLCFQSLPWPLPLPRMLWFHILMLSPRLMWLSCQRIGLGQSRMSASWSDFGSYDCLHAVNSLGMKEKHTFLHTFLSLLSLQEGLRRSQSLSTFYPF